MMFALEDCDESNPLYAHPLHEHLTESPTAVSYTHLDVYKRQMVEPRSTPLTRGHQGNGTLHQLINISTHQQISL